MTLEKSFNYASLTNLDSVLDLSVACCRTIPANVLLGLLKGLGESFPRRNSSKVKLTSCSQRNA